MEFLKNDEKGIGTIDFSKITPIPRWVYDFSPDIPGISSVDEEKWGSENTILNWQKKNWETKWNAYGQPDSRSTNDTIYFLTEIIVWKN